MTDNNNQGVAPQFNQPNQGAPVPQQRPMQRPQGSQMPQQRPMQQPQGSQMPQQRPMQQQQGSQMPQQRPMQQPQGAQMPQQRPMQQPQGAQMPQQRPMQQPQGAQMPQQRPMQQPQGAQMPQQRPMQQPQTPSPAAASSIAPNMAEGSGVQIIVRMFQPDMNLLKVTARQLSEIPHIKLNLYGQSGEVLVVITAQGRTDTATELAENAAAQLEAAMGDTVYSQGKKSLAYSVIAQMIKHEFDMIASDEDTGRILEDELRNVQNASKVFDFGENSYKDDRMADKIIDASIMDDEESEDPVQLSSDRSFAAQKCTKSDFGVSITGIGTSETVCIAITHRKLVYIRSVKTSKDAQKVAALTVFDMLRRIIDGAQIPYARVFKAAHEIDWNEPLSQKKAGKSSGKSKNLLIPIIVMVLVSIALGVGIWYIMQNFIVPDEGSVPVGGNTSVAEQIDSAEQDGQTEDTEADQTGTDTVEDDGVVGMPETASNQGEATGENSAVVHPFG